MPKRKTIEVSKLKAEINRRLALPAERHSDDERAALCALLETVLMDTGNYAGFNWLYWQQHGYQEWRDAGSPEEFPAKYRYLYGPGLHDDYRREYY